MKLLRTVTATVFLLGVSAPVFAATPTGSLLAQAQPSAAAPAPPPRPLPRAPMTAPGTTTAKPKAQAHRSTKAHTTRTATHHRTSHAQGRHPGRRLRPGRRWPGRARHHQPLTPTRADGARAAVPPDRRAMSTAPDESALPHRPLRQAGWDSSPGSRSAAGAACHRYTGERISGDEADRRGGRYLFHVDANRAIDATARDNLARYVNHACRPNCEARVVGRRIVIYARRAIVPGEELNYHYGRVYFRTFIAPAGCRCASCRRRAARGSRSVIA